MDNIELEQRLTELNKQITILKDKKDKEKQEQKECYEAIDAANCLMKTIENNIEDTCNVLKKRCSKLSEYNKLKNTYMIEATKILKGNNYYNALEKIQEFIKDMKKNIITSEDEDNSLDNRILVLENEMKKIKEILLQKE